MQIENTHRDDILRSASPVQHHLYSSPEGGGSLRLIAQKNNFSKNQDIYRKFALTVGDIVLGFYKIEDTVPLLQQELGVDPRTAALLGADVLDFLAPLSDPHFVPQAVVQTGSATTPDLTVHTAHHIEPVAPQAATTSPILSVLASNPAFQSGAVAEQTGAPYATTPLRTDVPETRDTARLNPYAILNDETPTYSSQQPPVRTPLSDLPTYHNPTAPYTPPTPVAPLEPPRWGT